MTKTLLSFYLLISLATSALDSKTEQAIQKELDAASAGRTTLVIAHRLSTVKKANKIVLLTRGKILESGTHNELINKNGLYTKMSKQQQL